MSSQQRQTARAKIEREVRKELADQVEALDLRRRKQIDNQIATINRLLDGHTYDEELSTLHEQLAEAQAKVEELTTAKEK